MQRPSCLRAPWIAWSDEHAHRRRPPGQIAPPIVLLPGDPLRARWIAENFLEGAELYSEVRGMLGFTGTWQGHRVSVQGSGMGQPSMSIYANELFQDYDVQTLVRVGSCGALTEKVGMRDIIIANGACTDSGINRIRFHGQDYAPPSPTSACCAAPSRRASGWTWSTQCTWACSSRATSSTTPAPPN